MSKFGTQIKPKFLCEVSFKFIFSHSFIFDYITYDMNPDKVLKNNLLTLEDKLFINSKILDDISGQTIPHKKRWLEPLIKYFIANTNWSSTDVLRVEPESGKLIVAYRIMQYIIVSSTKLPWTTVRQQYISFHFIFISPRASFPIATCSHQIPTFRPPTMKRKQKMSTTERSQRQRAAVSDPATWRKLPKQIKRQQNQKYVNECKLNDVFRTPGKILQLLVSGI